jgi:hypothetical protein
MALDLDAGAHQISFLAIRNTTPTTKDAEDTEEKNEEKQTGVKGEGTVREPAPPIFTAMDHQSMKGIDPNMFFAFAFPPCPPW